MPEFNFRVPGEVDGPVYADKQICVHGDYHIQDRIPVTVAPNTGDLDKGTIMGVTTSDSLFRPVRRSAISAAVANGATTVTVPLTELAKYVVGNTVGLCKADGSGVLNGGAITAINPATGVITFTTATTGTFAINDFVFVNDGSQAALAVLGDVVQDATSNKIANAFVAGKFFLTQLVGVDALASKDLGARSIPFGQNIAGQNESIYVV